MAQATCHRRTSPHPHHLVPIAHRRDGCRMHQIFNVVASVLVATVTPTRAQLVVVMIHTVRFGSGRLWGRVQRGPAAGSATRPSLAVHCRLVHRRARRIQRGSVALVCHPSHCRQQRTAPPLPDSLPMPVACSAPDCTKTPAQPALGRARQRAATTRAAQSGNSRTWLPLAAAAGEVSASSQQLTPRAGSAARESRRHRPLRHPRLRHRSEGRTWGLCPAPNQARISAW